MFIGNIQGLTKYKRESKGNWNILIGPFNKQQLYKQWKIKCVWIHYHALKLIYYHGLI